MKEAITNPNLDFLSGGGEMGELIRSKDWSKTPLGSPDKWPQSLRTAVSICIASNFPICISWGQQRVQIYNDGYWPITGDMHPQSMGQDFKVCWRSAWPVIGQAFEEAFLGATRFLETQRIFLDRYGYKEETFFTFSFSPILDETGAIGGLFHPVIEQTQQTLSERRLNILPAIANHTVNARNTQEAAILIMDCLKDFNLDIPFVLLYSVTDDGKEAILESSIGVETNSVIAPAKFCLEENTLKSWPFYEVILNKKVVQVEKLGHLFGSFNCLPYPEPPEQAVVFPITLPGTAHNNYLLVAGVSSRRRLDEKYLLFYDLFASAITSALTKARVSEIEQKKAEALAEIDKAKTVFFANISHEFRTPLTLILSPLEELLNQQKSNFSEIEKGNIQTIHRNAMRLLKLVNTLLDFSRIESGRQQANFSLVDVVALTTNLSANFRAVIEKAGMKLIVKADSIIQPVYVDKQMWEKIVFNLLSNAFKYTLKGSIIVELTSEKDFAVLKIRDTGVGIPEEELPKMFERFHRVQNVTGRTHEGTGIGLSLIKELVLMHKGVISVESKIGQGSVFIVKIPLGKEHLNGRNISATEMDAEIITANIYVDEAETLLDSDKKQKIKSFNSKEKSGLPLVLIVDDNADMREHISQVLSDDFNIITAINGMDALQKLKTATPDLVLSDVMMPIMDGIELLKEIKSNKSTATIPVILLTARAGEESKIEGWETGADDYLTKPFSAKELLARIQSQIKIIKLRQSLENNVRNLFSQAPIAIAVLRGSQHVFELANKMYLQITGNKDVMNKSVRDAFPELEGTGIYELLDHVYLTGQPFIASEMLVKLDKGNGKLEEVYVNFVYHPSQDSEGEIDGILVHAVDVTEQVISRKKIEESNQKIRNLIAQAPVAMCLYKGEQFIVEIVNERMLHIWDKELETVLNKSVFEVMPEARERGFEELLQKVYITGESFSANEISINLVRNGKNEKIFVNLLYEPYRENDGTVTGIVEVANDVTEQVLSRQKIEESDKQFSTLANNIQNLAWIADREGWIFWYNQRWYDYTGTNLEEMQGWGWEQALHPDHLKRVVDFVKQAWDKNEPFELTFPLRGIDGNYRWFLTRAFPVNDTEGKIISWIGTNTDIQEQKSFSEQLEKKVNERTIQLNEVNESLKEKNIELINMNKELEAFTYISSHDLQEPLRKIQTFAGRIIATDKKHLSENAQEYFRRMNDAAERMRTLIQDLLAFSRISTLERKFEATNLNKIVEEVKEEFKEILAEKQATIDVSEMCELKIIPFQFRQLMHNLISNALKFAKHDVPSHIVIKSEIVKGNEVNKENLLPQKKYCHISVSDNGIGFEKQFTEKIFQVFQKLHGKEQYSGTGIGLAIVKKIIDNHNGIITTESKLGKGATFNIYLPM